MDEPRLNVGTLNAGQPETITISATVDTNNSILPVHPIINQITNSQDQSIIILHQILLLLN